MAVPQPQPPVTAVAETTGTETAATETRAAPLSGRNELGRITVADHVVTKIAAQAAAENPDAGAAAVRVLGKKKTRK